MKTIPNHNKHLKICGVLLAALSLSPAAYAHSNCQTVRFSNVGWTDIAATTASASIILKGLGYQTTTQMLSVPVTYRSLANKDIDVFLGNWMPSMAADIAKYKKNGTVDTVRANLTGAKYTLAVPQYVYDAGVHSFADLQKFAGQFHRKIYGIEPGNDGNRLIQKMINKDAFGLKRFDLVESSEAGMISQLKRAIRRHQWIVFLGWEPHPMNTNFKIKYLSGGDDYFGPNYGGAKVYTNVRHNYLKECPNVGHFLKNLKFTLNMENQIMDGIINGGMQPQQAAKTWLQKHPNVLPIWLRGVRTKSGKPGLPAVKASLGLK